MKILIIVWNFYPNTAYTNRTKATVKGFVECGCHCDVLSIKPLTVAEEVCLNKECVPEESKVRTLLGMLRNYQLLKRSIKHYDVIYCTTGNVRVDGESMKLARKYGKAIVHERTEFPDIFYGKSGGALKKLNDYLHQVQRYDHLFVISNPIKEYFVENGMPEEKISIYPMIVDPNRFTNIQKHDVGYRYIAYCGNLSNSKDGVADLIEAYGQSEAKVSYKLMLIGAKPSGREMEIYNSSIIKYGLEDRIIFRGSVERDEMPQILTDADLLVLSRPNNRQALGGFPTKLGEYLSTGNPVLVTRVGDIDKYIVDGENGYLSAPNDVEEFSKKIDGVFADYETAKRVGMRGKELVYNEFNYNVQTKHVVEQLEKLV